MDSQRNSNDFTSVFEPCLLSPLSNSKDAFRERDNEVPVLQEKFNTTASQQQFEASTASAERIRGPFAQILRKEDSHRSSVEYHEESVKVEK